MQTIAFNPAATTGPLEFQPTLDGNPYNAIITWNLWGFQADGVNKRPYLNLYSLGGTRIVTTPLVGSPLDYAINIVGRYFLTSSIVYYPDTGQIVISP